MSVVCMWIPGWIKMLHPLQPTRMQQHAVTIQGQCVPGLLLPCPRAGPSDAAGAGALLLFAPAAEVPCRKTQRMARVSFVWETEPAGQVNSSRRRFLLLLFHTCPLIFYEPRLKAKAQKRVARLLQFFVAHLRVGGEASGFTSCVNNNTRRKYEGPRKMSSRPLSIFLSRVNFKNNNALEKHTSAIHMCSNPVSYNGSVASTTDKQKQPPDATPEIKSTPTELVSKCAAINMIFLTRAARRLGRRRILCFLAKKTSSSHSTHLSSPATVLAAPAHN